MAQQLENELSDDTPQPWLERLGRLLEAQLNHRRERSIERRIAAAGFPARKTLDAFDFVFQTGVDQDQIMHLATLDWLEHRRSILLAGMSGTGKSHIAISLGILACAHGHAVRYTTSANLLTELHLALTTGTMQLALKPFTRCTLLIVDEVGLDKAERQAYRTDDASLLYKVIAARYEKGRSCLITTNIDWDKWGDYLGDDIATAAILDRLAHHSYSININGPSWRAREHLRLNRAPDVQPPVGD
jgi:DNA replication protein DnaC